MYFILIILNISFIYKCNNNVLLTKTEVAKSTMFSIRVFVFKSGL